MELCAAPRCHSDSCREIPTRSKNFLDKSPGDMRAPETFRISTLQVFREPSASADITALRLVSDTVARHFVQGSAKETRSA